MADDFGWLAGNSKPPVCVGEVQWDDESGTPKWMLKTLVMIILRARGGGGTENDYLLCPFD